MMKAVAKRIARVIFGDYAIYCVYRCGALPAKETRHRVEELSEDDIRAASDPNIAGQAGYAGTGAHAFGIREEGVLQAVCFYWHGERYRPRGFWSLEASEAKLVQIITAPSARGRGLATALIRGSASAMQHGHGWSRLFARVWHSNRPSRAAFERAGWEQIAVVLEVNPLRLRRAWRLSWRVGPA
jgi:RimJ/RimL family protein N-acetyltransferase